MPSVYHCVVFRLFLLQSIAINGLRQPLILEAQLDKGEWSSARPLCWRGPFPNTNSIHGFRPKQQGPGQLVLSQMFKALC